MENVLEITNLCKSYNNFKLDNISFSVPKGCIMGFIGENGAGKTTTIKLILDVIKKDAGTIHLFGNEISDLDTKTKESIGVSFDDIHFYENIRAKDINTILKNIHSNWDSNKFFKYLEDFSLPQAKPIKEYSKGMKMKLSITCALSHNPKLLILDEPTSGLDPVTRSEILDIFQDFIQDDEHSILLSSHITSDLEKIADYITFIHNGKIILSATKDELLYNYGIIKCSKDEFDKLDKNDIIRYRHNQFGYEVLINNINILKRKYTDLLIDNITIDDIMVFYVKGEAL